MRGFPMPFTQWLVFGFGAVAGFMLAVAANVATKLFALAALSFASGWLIGRYWPRREAPPARANPGWRFRSENGNCEIY